MERKSELKPIIVLGATATGKSDFAIELALRLNGEVISCDSMQIYRGLNIGTGKVTHKERKGVTHHLLDVAQANEDFSAEKFKRMCINTISRLKNEGKQSVIAGGTGLFIKGLLYGHSFAANKDEGIRRELERFSNEELYNKLSECDSEAAKKLHINDRLRLVRALEIFMASGKTKSELNALDAKERTLSALVFGLDMDRGELYRRINARVDRMFEMGLVDEVASLLEYKDCQSMKAIGYRELVGYFEGKTTLDEAREQIKQHTRNYAKRQLTFFRAMSDIVWLDALADFEKNFEIIKEML